MFLVALSEDFNIYLVSRLREQLSEIGRAEGSARAVGLTGGVISSAGLVMAAAFFLFLAIRYPSSRARGGRRRQAYCSTRCWPGRSWYRHSFGCWGTGLASRSLESPRCRSLVNRCRVRSRSHVPARARPFLPADIFRL